ncbi:MAG: hypothetical protein, partial [Olavius algarvensis Gamma 1 endosymbiont]
VPHVDQPIVAPPAVRVDHASPTLPRIAPCSCFWEAAG